MPLSENKKDRVIAWGLFAAAWLVGSSLLWFGGKTLSSPDETAVLVTAQDIAQSYSARMPEPLAAKAGWLHPRSWVSQGEGIVPVGFIGWPWILSVFILITGTAFTKWLSIAIAASSVPALYVLLRKRFSRPASLVGTLTLFSYPAFFLYLNRSLFPNPPILAATLWLTYFLKADLLSNTKSDQQKIYQNYWREFVIGILFAAICVIRPIELFWVLPWLGAVAYTKQLHPTRKQLLAVVTGMGVILLPVWILAWRTYGAPWSVGYFLRDNSTPASVGVGGSEGAGSSAVRLLAFGFHPRNVWWNLRSFGFGFALPWAALLIGVAALYLKPWAEVCWKYRRKLKSVLRELASPDHGFIAAILGLGLLAAYYGNGLYTDHVRVGAVTVGNSYLRYLLPVAAVSGWAIAWLYDRVEKGRPQKIVLAIAFVLCSFGLYRGAFGDDESVLAVIQSTRLNDQTRTKTEQVMPAESIIFSDRSDKIFFPTYKAVSPMPSLPEVSRLLKSTEVPAAFYSRPLNQKQRDEWRNHGLQLEELFAFDRHVLYRIRHLP